MTLSRSDHSFHRWPFHWYTVIHYILWAVLEIMISGSVSTMQLSSARMHIFQKCGNHLQLLGARRVTWTMLYSWGPPVLEWSMDLTAIRCLLFCAWKHTRFYVRGKNCNFSENIGYHRRKVIRQGDQAPGICASLVQTVFPSEAFVPFTPVRYCHLVPLELPIR